MEQWAEIRRMHFVQGALDQEDRAAHRPRSKDDPTGDQEP